MGDLIKIIGAAFLTATAATLLKSTKPELSFAVTITGIVIILLFIVDMIKGTLGVLTEIGTITGMDSGLIRQLIKIVGIGYLTEFSANVLTDFNASSLADKVILGGKLTIVVMSMPIIGGLLSLFKQFIELL